MQVIDVAQGPLATVARPRPVAEVARIMAEQGLRAVVVEDGGRPVGIVTDLDLVSRVLARGLTPDTPVEAVMTPDPITVEATDPLDAVYALIQQYGVRQLPLTRDGQLVGIVGLDDLVSELSAELRRLLPDRDPDLG